MSNPVKTGRVYFWLNLSVAQMQELYAGLFPANSPAYIFSGEVTRYTYTKDGEQPEFLKSLTGRAFNHEVELRWEQYQPEIFKALLLTEASELKSLEAFTAKYVPSEYRNFVADARRTEALLKLYDKDDRRLPQPPRRLGTTYIYYSEVTAGSSQTQVDGQIRFIRLAVAP